MLHNILCIVMIVLMAVGLVTVVRGIFLKLLSPRRDYRVFTAVPLEGHIEDAEYILRHEQHFNTRHENKEAKLVVIDCGMDSETQKICAVLLQDGIIDGIYTPNNISVLYKG